MVAGRPGGADLGGEHGDAGALAPRLRARDQPPDPELARQAEPALPDAARGDRWSRRWSRSALVIPTDVDLLGGLFAFGATIAFTIAHLSIIRLRIDRARPRAAVPDPVRRHAPRRPDPAAGAGRGGADGARLGQRDRLPRLARAGSAAAGWCSGSSRYVDLPQGGRGHDADRAGRGARRRRWSRTSARSSTATSWCRSSAPSSTTTSSAPRAGSPTPPTSRARTAPRLEVIYVDRPAADRAARLAAAADRAEQPRTRRWSGRRRSGRSTRRSRSHPSVVRRADVGAGIVRGGAGARRGDDRHGRRAADPDQGRGGARRDRRLAAGGDRAGDRVRAAPGALPGAGDGAAERRLAARAPRAPEPSADEAIGREGSLPVRRVAGAAARKIRPCSS